MGRTRLIILTRIITFVVIKIIIINIIIIIIKLFYFSVPAVGEPPLCMAFGIVSALREAIAAARADTGVTGWFEMREYTRGNLRDA